MRRSAPATRQLTTAALVTALIAASAWVTLPLGTVPVTLQTFVVVLSALLLPASWAFASIALYLVMGAAGLPVFSGAHGGFGVIAGPTGGYLIGFAVAALVGALVRVALERHVPRLASDVAAAIVAIVAIYAVGWLWLAQVTHMGLAQAFVAGVAPFLVVDAAKAAAAIVVATAVRRALGGAGAATPAERAA